MAGTEGDGRLTNKHYTRLAEVISGPNMETIAQGYLDINADVITSVKVEKMMMVTPCNVALLQKWAHKPENSGTDQIKKLARLLYEASDHGSYVNPVYVKDILGFTVEEARSDDTTPAPSVPHHVQQAPSVTTPSQQAPSVPTSTQQASSVPTPAQQAPSITDEPQVTSTTTADQQATPDAATNDAVPSVPEEKGPTLNMAMLIKLSQRINSEEELFILALMGLGVKEELVEGHLRNNSTEIHTAARKVLSDWRKSRENDEVAYTELCAALRHKDVNKARYIATCLQ